LEAITWALGYNPPEDPMSLIMATDLAKAYGAQDVFSGVSIAVPHQARIALVGPNGIGKSTLLKLLSGKEKPDKGQMLRSRALRIGYLPQEAVFSLSNQASPEQTLWECCLEAFEELRAQEAKLASLEEAMAEPRHAEEAIARYGTLQEDFERSGGYTYPVRIRRVLDGLGFSPAKFHQPLEQLSGGEKTRAMLAQLLLEDPDLLLLDEPTNHLDIQAVEWLEAWLRDWPGAAVLVSHDRYFLDRTVEMVWDLSPQGIEVFRGNYASYVHQYAERRRYQEARFKAQQQVVKREQEYIRRNIAGQNTRQAQGRRKRLERMLQQEAMIHLEKRRNVRIDFGSVSRSGERVLETSGLVIGYPDSNESLFEVPDLVLTRGECVALIGPNGTGKTTFIKTLLGEVEPLAGEVRLGASLRVGYFAQVDKGLTPERTVMEEIFSIDSSLSYSQARELLARFLFFGDAINKPIEVLSGGERGRVALAKLALGGSNLLLLDEPTNQLDISSQEVLQESLMEFPGTILLVSHDRYLIDALATQVWVITPTERELEVHIGGYNVYLQAKRKDEESRKAHRKLAARRPEKGRVKSSAELESVEARIQALEGELAQVASELEEAGGDVDRVRILGNRYATLEADLEAQFVVWERLAQDGW
jgi:ATP-binding cassette subfamily F protein 3